MNKVDEAIERANNKVKSIEVLLMNTTTEELELMKEVAKSNRATASFNSLHLEETFYSDLEELMDNIIAEKLILRSINAK